MWASRCAGSGLGFMQPAARSAACCAPAEPARPSLARPARGAGEGRHSRAGRLRERGRQCLRLEPRLSGGPGRACRTGGSTGLTGAPAAAAAIATATWTHAHALTGGLSASVRGRARWRPSGCSACRSTCWSATSRRTPTRPPARPTAATRACSSRAASPCRCRTWLLPAAVAQCGSSARAALSAGSPVVRGSGAPFVVAECARHHAAPCSLCGDPAAGPVPRMPASARHRAAGGRLERVCVRAAGGAVGGGGGAPHGGRDRRRRVRVGQQRVRPAGHAHFPRPRHARQGLRLAPCGRGRGLSGQPYHTLPYLFPTARRPALLTPGCAPAAGAGPRGRGRRAGGLRRGSHAVPVQVPPRALTASHVGPMAGLIIRSAGVARV